MANEDELIAQYSGITGESAAKSRQYLEAFNWNIQSAIEDHYGRQQSEENDPDYEDDVAQEPQQSSGGGRRLGDGPSTSQPIPVAPLSSAPKPKTSAAPKKRFATLGDVGSSDAKDDTDDDEHQDLFAGGEKSGLAVQNPDDLKKKIIEKAAKNPRPTDEEPPKKNNFTGNARTLGGDDAPSREIPADPQNVPAERVRRVLHFWRDGFSVDDGDLYRFDDQRNAEMLQLIRSGRAPLHIMNVEAGQEVDVEVRPHEEDYVKPKKQYKAFEGQGNRLGSPTPGISTSNMPGSFITDPLSAPSTSSAPPTSQVDESKPTVTLRISLGSGTRLTSRFNTDQTIGDVYDFVRRAETGGRAFVLQTTFPTTELTDQSKVLGDMPEFKRGGAVVQKYT